ncbi:MAG: diacylglycerol kinase family protein [Dehalococcoidia bacterium]|nr:diacylglycerol kinase family protein [Dehalococcoidia bacterium]
MIKKFTKSFVYAGCGLWYCLRHERNFRIHLVLAVYALWLAAALSMARAEWVVLLVTIAVVISAEIFNTALERIVDLIVGEKYDSMARLAKDVAAGLVLFCAIVAVAVGYALFWRPQDLSILMAQFWQVPWRVLTIIFSVIVSLGFIFGGGVPRSIGNGEGLGRARYFPNIIKPISLVITSFVLVVAVSVGFAVHGMGDVVKERNWDEVVFPHESIEGIFFECYGAQYSPEFSLISAQLKNQFATGHYVCGTSFTIAKQVGNVWKKVPFRSGTVFTSIAIGLNIGSSYDYSVQPAMLSVKLREGQYRIITDISFYESEGNQAHKYTVWADFTIKKNAPEWYPMLDS